jgi:hypothetical protein
MVMPTACRVKKSRLPLSNAEMAKTNKMIIARSYYRLGLLRANVSLSEMEFFLAHTPTARVHARQESSALSAL